MNLNEVIRETIALLQEKASKNSILIRTQLDAVLPTISADRVQVQQVLMNLILNGIEAMKETRGELIITSETGEHSQVLISVRDSGVRLPVGNPELIFEAFFTTKPEGTGMGLSLSRRIIVHKPEDHRVAWRSFECKRQPQKAGQYFISLCLVLLW